MVTKFIETILEDLCLDDRIKDGAFRIDNTEHVLILKEYATKMVDEEFAQTLITALSEDGQYPERQAYNKDGKLVTFPDTESKKAALDRKTHFNQPPGGKDNEEETDEVPSEEEEEESQEGDIYADIESAEDAVAARDRGELTDAEANYIIKFSEDFGDEKLSINDFDNEGVFHVYDILDDITRAQKRGAGEDEEVVSKFSSPEDAVLSGELDPTILFALSEKWTFDRGGNWFDETGKFRASTNIKGELLTKTPEDREEMLLWVDDFLKRQGQS